MPRLTIENMTTGHKTFSDTVTQHEANAIISAVSSALVCSSNDSERVRITVSDDAPVNQTGQHAEHREPGQTFVNGDGEEFQSDSLDLD